MSCKRNLDYWSCRDLKTCFNETSPNLGQITLKKFPDVLFNANFNFVWESSESIKSFFAFRVMTVRIKQTMMHYSKYKPFKYDPTDSFTRFAMVIVNCNLFMLKAYKALLGNSSEHFASCRIAAKSKIKNNSKAQQEERERRQFND